VAEAFCAVEIGGLFRREEEGIFCVRRKVRPSAWRVGSRWVVVGRGMDCVGFVMMRVQEEARVVSVVYVGMRERLSYRSPTLLSPAPHALSRAMRVEKRKRKVPKYPDG
jgi:hypothetical protein